MAEMTPRRSTRSLYTHTPKMSERKKGLFQGEGGNARESMTKHRNLPVLNSESDSEDCVLGIISTLDSCSSDETDGGPRTPDSRGRHDTRSQTQRLRNNNNDLKSFIKSPFTLKKYRHSCLEKCPGSLSTPGTPHIQSYHPGTPSSTHSCTSVHTTASSSSKARKSLADLIADTESCSSSLKDLNFDTDTSTDSKENTPTKPRRSSRKKTPKLNSFKGILVEQKKNVTPMKTAVVCLTKMDMDSLLSPTQMLKTPDNSSEVVSPPKIRRSVVEIAESPESVDGEQKSQKRLHYDGMTDVGPSAKHPRLDLCSVPKARASLFNSDRLKEILSAKSFYGKTNPELNTTVTAKLSSAIEATTTQKRHNHSHSRREKRRPGQINSGVRHKIRKPKIHKHKIIIVKRRPILTSSASNLNNSTLSNTSANNTSMLSQNTSQENCNDKADPFDKEKQTIDALLSQWEEEEVPQSELSYSKPDNTIFTSTILEETNQILHTATAVPVTTTQLLSQDSDRVIMELGAQGTVHRGSELGSDVAMSEAEHSADHGDAPKNGQFLPVEGGYILVDENTTQSEEDCPDLDEIERELRMLDEQIYKMAESNNINAHAVLASTETMVAVPSDVTSGVTNALSDDTSGVTNALRNVTGSETNASCDITNSVTNASSDVTGGVTNALSDVTNDKKLFPIFSKPNPGISTPIGKDKSKKIIKTGLDQYVIDAGQKKFGATQCTECGVIYQIGDPQDEHDHLVHHNATDVLKFNGFKDEHIQLRTESGRVIRVRGGTSGWRRVEALLNRVVHPSLGFSGPLPGDSLLGYTAYIYVEKKLIVGCCIVEPKSKAYKLIPGEPDCCSVESYPVKCGISRIWTHSSYRRRGIASRLIDCARVSYLYGCVLSCKDIAFSAPTPAGKELASKYCGTSNFNVYLD